MPPRTDPGRLVVQHSKAKHRGDLQMILKPRSNRRRGLAAGAVAALIAVASIVALESTGTVLTEAYSGLGGKLSPALEHKPAGIAPVAAPPY